MHTILAPQAIISILLAWVAPTVSELDKRKLEILRKNYQALHGETLVTRPSVPEKPPGLSSFGLYKHGISTGAALAISIPTSKDSTVGSSAAVYLAVNPFTWGRIGPEHRDFCGARHAFEGRSQEYADAKAAQRAYDASQNWEGPKGVQQQPQPLDVTPSVVPTRADFQQFKASDRDADRYKAFLEKSRIEATAQIGQVNAEISVAKTELNAASNASDVEDAGAKLEELAAKRQMLLRAKISMDEVGWVPGVPATCRRYWAPGLYAGYVFAPSAIEEDGGYAKNTSADAVGMGSFGVSWAPTPYFALMAGAAVFRFPTGMAGAVEYETVWRPVIMLGGTLDTFSRLLK